MSVFVFIIIIVALVTFGEVASKRVAARPPTPVEPGRDAEVERLREHVALLASQVDRLTEEQRFMTRLLEGAAPASRAPSDESRPEGRPDSRLRGPN
ncbi:hypothetical protein [Candidatus Palauibacter sp.]|uniref:hypothetical protein n=1 Tax=Candidatus Palauibacter sp. TaxID=3101350 RepID=UPI003B52E048